MSILFQSQGIPLSRPVRQVGVFRYDGEGDYFFMPNLRCLQVEYQNGAHPGSARFRYVFAENADEAFPDRSGDVMALDADGPLVVKQDDRLVVRAYLDEGDWEVLFDGFALMPQGDLDRATELVTFTALGAPIRCWDEPIRGALMRDASRPDKVNADTQTSLPARFNPQGHPNASSAGRDSGQQPQQYPVFLGPIWPPTDPDPDDETKRISKIHGETIRGWTLGMAARHVVLVGLRKDDGKIDERYVKVGDVRDWDRGLSTFVPAKEGTEIDYGDPSTYKVQPIEVVDYDVTGEPWPVALERLITPHGFDFRFQLETNEDGDPEWHLKVYDATFNFSVKSLFLQPHGDPFDPGECNLGAMSLARDSQGLINAFALDSAPVRFEVGICPAPGFQIVAAEADDPSQFAGSSTSKYRDFVFDECGEGHADADRNWVTGKPGDLSPVLGSNTKKKKSFAVRRRPASKATILTLDDEKKPLNAKLYVSSDYSGPMPALWDGTGVWQEVDTHEWELLPDRLGFRITSHDPNSFSIGYPADNANVAYDSSPSKINLVEWTAKPTADFPAPRFLLVCQIEGDLGLDAKTDKRAASPTQFTIRRRIDARDRFKKGIVTRYSYLANETGPSGQDETAYNDQTDAQAQADGMRRAHELPDFAGSVRIPRITSAYRIGDKIDQLHGRDVSFQQNAAVEQGESPVYPQVVGITYELDGGQATVLHLTDRRAEPPPKHRESRDD